MIDELLRERYQLQEELHADPNNSALTEKVRGLDLRLKEAQTDRVVQECAKDMDYANEKFKIHGDVERFEREVKFYLAKRLYRLTCVHFGNERAAELLLEVSDLAPYVTDIISGTTPDF